jgi:hypothetical protein
MARAQERCPVCGGTLGVGARARPVRGQFVLEYHGCHIELCSWVCFCGFFQEPEQYYTNYQQETHPSIPVRGNVQRS